MGKPFLTLNQFMLRGKVLKQYRQFVRTAQKLPDKRNGQDIVNWVRADFKNNSTIPHSEEDKIKSLLLYGDKMLKELKQSVDLSTAS